MNINICIKCCVACNNIYSFWFFKILMNFATSVACRKFPDRNVYHIDKIKIKNLMSSHFYVIQEKRRKTTIHITI